MSESLNGHTSRLPQALSKPELIKAALDVLVDLLAEGEPLRITIDRDGLRADLVVEDAEEAPTATTSKVGRSASDLNGCRQEILAMFRAEMRRMTAGQVHQWLQDHGKDYTPSSVIKSLTELRGVGQLDNGTDEYGKGYGLPEWSNHG
jgi:hypothetical protein